jgi:hypothetical protein
VWQKKGLLLAFLSHALFFSLSPHDAKLFDMGTQMFGKNIIITKRDDDDDVIEVYFNIS